MAMRAAGVFWATLNLAFGVWNLWFVAQPDNDTTWLSGIVSGVCFVTAGMFIASVIEDSL